MHTTTFTIQALVAAIGCCGTLAHAQDSQQVRFEVFNGATWSSSVDVGPEARIEFRVVVSYTGTRTDLLALGSMRFQPTISNFDLTGSDTQRDRLHPWRNGGVSGNNIPGSMISQAEAASPSLPSYGRVFPFGAVAMNAAGQNTLTEFHHQNGSDRAPAGSWARLAGGFSSNWPLPALTNVPVPADEMLNIDRGIAISQLAVISAGTAWQGGTQNIVVFRGAITLGDQLLRTLVLGAAQGSFLRNGDAQSADDSRYIAWQTSPADAGSHRAFNTVIVPGHINILVPAPSALALAAAGLLAAARRRR